MFDLNKEVAEAHQNVTHAETQARAIETRIKKIDGAAELLPPRGYGRPFDTAALAKSLTLRSLLAKHDPELASYLGVPSDAHIREEEDQEARALRVKSLEAQTERLRRQNAARRHHVEQSFARGVQPYSNRRLGQ